MYHNKDSLDAMNHILYVGNYKGLDAAISKIQANHNWQVTLDLANINIACLSFNPIGHMVYIGMHLQEQLWLAIDSIPSTALTQHYALMIIIFIAYAFTEILFQDIHCQKCYPVPLTCTAIKESTDILLFVRERVDKNHQHIILQLEDFK
ncbi:hypothetical protein BDR06DRAFT_974770 [Suillus hirtellus]|nr:hypothetical protein BDR06DRAFT_974770 [Suillus hirtellus]